MRKVISHTFPITIILCRRFLISYVIKGKSPELLALPLQIPTYVEVSICQLNFAIYSYETILLSSAQYFSDAVNSLYLHHGNVGDEQFVADGEKKMLTRDRFQAVENGSYVLP